MHKNSSSIEMLAYGYQDHADGSKSLSTEEIEPAMNFGSPVKLGLCFWEEAMNVDIHFSTF
jgi:hypothetical protein